MSQAVYITEFSNSMFIILNLEGVLEGYQLEIINFHSEVASNCLEDKIHVMKYSILQQEK